MESKSLFLPSSVMTFWMSKLVTISFLQLQIILPSLFLLFFTYFLYNFYLLLHILKPAKSFPQWNLNLIITMEDFRNIWSWVHLASKVYLLFRTPKHFPDHGHHYQSSFTRWEAGQWGGRTGSNRWPQIHPQKYLKCPKEYVFKICQHLKYQEKNNCQHLDSQQNK